MGEMKRTHPNGGELDQSEKEGYDVSEFRDRWFG